MVAKPNATVKIVLILASTSSKFSLIKSCFVSCLWISQVQNQSFELLFVAHVSSHDVWIIAMKTIWENSNVNWHGWYFNGSRKQAVCQNFASSIQQLTGSHLHVNQHYLHRDLPHQRSSQNWYVSTHPQIASMFYAANLDRVVEQSSYHRMMK